jgi:DNA-binding response OmpR family regulator
MNWEARPANGDQAGPSPTKHTGSAANGGGRSARILLVEDDLSMQHMVANYLEQHNMRLVCAANRQEMTRQFAAGEPGLVILDLRLGQEDGLDLLREIRSRSDVPVIIITGHRRDEIDRVVGLELGADDYLTKPFSLRELLARIRAVLTKGEYALLIAFLDAPQRPLTREHLLQATRVHEDVFDRSIDVQILRLRRKLEADPSLPRVIRTERGVGYVFALAVETL